VHCRYLGFETRTYVQYLDAEASTTLIASPGGSYDIVPAGSLDFPVPPADGLWEAEASPPPPPQASPAAVPPPLMTAASTEDEGN
jgi:hypothetical protein